MKCYNNYLMESIKGAKGKQDKEDWPVKCISKEPEEIASLTDIDAVGDCLQDHCYMK